jgi:hypothetical protein
MTGKKTLMSRLDAASEQLLDRYFGEHEGKPVKGAEQVKAFEAVVKYFGPRTRQADDDKGGSAFEQLRSDFNGNSRTTSRRSRAGRTNGAGPAPEAADAAAGNATAGADHGAKDH